MAEVDIGSDTYDVFADIDFADLFLAGDVMRGPAWAAIVDEDSKARGLVSATRMLLGLAWCADPAPLPTDLVIDPAIQEITAQLAADLIATPELFADASGDSNVKAVGAGSARVEFFAPVLGGPAIPRSMWNRLVAAGLTGCVSAEPSDGMLVSGACAPCRPLGGRYANDWPFACEDHD